MKDPINRDQLRPKFWENHELENITRAEWEALCDGCGRCCLLKLEDADTGLVHYTNVGCRLLDDNTCRCGQYALRRQMVPGCVVITPENLEEIADWMPGNCAYRLLYEGRKLPLWHPLISGNPDSVHVAGISMRGKTLAEYDIDEDDLEDHLIEGMH